MPLETEYLGYVWKKDKCKARILQSLYTIVCGKLSKKTPEGTYIWKFEQRKKSDLLLKCSLKYPHSTEQLTGRNVCSWEMKSFPNWSSPDCDFISSSSSTSFLHPPSSSATASTDTLGHTERYGDYTLAFSPPLSSLTLSFYPYSFPSPSFILLSFYCYRPLFPPFLFSPFPSHLFYVSSLSQSPLTVHSCLTCWRRQDEAAQCGTSAVWDSLSHTPTCSIQNYMSTMNILLSIINFFCKNILLLKWQPRFSAICTLCDWGWAFSQAIYSLHTEVL